MCLHSINSRAPSVSSIIIAHVKRYQTTCTTAAANESEYIICSSSNPSEMKQFAGGQMNITQSLSLPHILVSLRLTLRRRNCSGIPAFVCDVASSTPSMTDSAKAKTSPSLALTFASRLIYEPMIVVVRPCRRCYPLSIARSL